MFSLRTGAKKNQSIFTILCHFFDAFWYYFLYVQQACCKRPVFGQTVNPILTRGDRYIMPTTVLWGLPDFQTLRRAWYSIGKYIA